jgi:hypothetical protein
VRGLLDVQGGLERADLGVLLGDELAEVVVLGAEVGAG